MKPNAEVDENGQSLSPRSKRTALARFSRFMRSLSFVVTWSMLIYCTVGMVLLGGPGRGVHSRVAEDVSFSFLEIAASTILISWIILLVAATVSYWSRTNANHSLLGLLFLNALVIFNLFVLAASR